MPSKFPIWIEGVWVFEPLLLPSRSALAGSWSLALKLGLKPRHFGMGCRCFTFRLNVCPMHLNTIYICSAWHDVFMYVYIEEWLKLMEVCTIPHAYIFKKQWQHLKSTVAVSFKSTRHCYELHLPCCVICFLNLFCVHFDWSNPSRSPPPQPL